MAIGAISAAASGAISNAAALPGTTAATKVDFESSLRRAVSIGQPNAATPSTSKSTEPNGPNDNNVNIDDETVSMIDTNLKYQTMVEAMNAKFRLLRTAIEG